MVKCGRLFLTGASGLGEIANVLNAGQTDERKGRQQSKRNRRDQLHERLGHGGTETTVNSTATVAKPQASSTTDHDLPAPPPPPATPPDPGTWLPGLTLNDRHREHLRESGLTDASIDASGIRTASAPQLEALGFAAKDGPALVIPYPHPTLVNHYRIRPDDLRNFDVKAKYRTRPGDSNRLYIPLGTWTVIEDPKIPLLIAEGEKKALAAMQAGFNAIGVPGVYGWRSKGGPIEDLDLPKWRDRRVIVVYDSDVWTNDNVREALRRLVGELENRGADVHVVLLPPGPDGEKVGLDDYLVAHGEEKLTALIDQAVPLADAAMSFIKPGLTPSKQQEVLDYVGRVAGLYPAAEADFIRKIGEAVIKAGYSNPGKRVLAKIITKGTKAAANAESGSERERPGPEVFAERFLKETWSDENGRRTLHCLHGELLAYRGKVYEAVREPQFLLDVTTLLQAATKQVTSCLAANVTLNIRAMCRLPEDTPLPSWLTDDWDKGSNVVAFENGLVNLPTAVNGCPNIVPHTPAFLNMQMFPFCFNPQATCPRWTQFLTETFAGDQQRIWRLQDWFGAHLDLDQRIEKFALFVGDGANGKSVILRILAEVLGKQNTVAIPLDRLGERFQCGRLRGKVANIVGDLEDTDKAAEGILKMLVSGEPVIGEFKNQDAFTFVPRARHTFSTNAFPRFRDRSNGLWRRLLLLVFDQTVAEAQQDLQLAEKIVQQELPGVFNWALAGLRRLHDNPIFTASQVCDQASDRYRVQCNPVATFVAEYCEVGPGASVPKAHMYEAYTGWCRANGHKPLSNARFGIELHRAVPGLQDARPVVEGSRVTVYEGISLAGNSAQLFQLRR